MKERVYHMPLGGMNEVGDRNCHAIVYVDKHGHKEAVLFDCGQKVPLDAPEDQELGPEYFPDFSQLFAQDIHIRAVLVSHAHLDHVGALPYLCELINGQRSGEGAPLIVCSDFAKDVIYNIVFRGYCGAKFTSRKRLRIGPFDIEMFPVIHSTPGSRGFSVRVGGEHTVYLGDCKLANHIPETQGEEDEFSRRLALLGHERPDALLLDSTNSDKYISTGFERDVRTAIRADMIKNADVRLFMVTFASHIDRLGDTLRCAEQMGRPVFVRASNMSKYLRIAGMKSWRWYGEDPNTHTFPNVPKNAIMLLSGAQAEPNSALVRFMKGSLPMPVDETRDALMFACSTIPKEPIIERVEEMIADLQQNFHRLYLGPNVRAREEYDNVTRGLYHVSGHAGRRDLEKIVAAVKPRLVIPVHAERERREAVGSLIPRTSSLYVAEEGEEIVL